MQQVIAQINGLQNRIRYSQTDYDNTKARSIADILRDIEQLEQNRSIYDPQIEEIKGQRSTNPPAQNFRKFLKIIRNILVRVFEPVCPVLVRGSLIKGRMESREEHLSELKKQHETVEDEVFLTFCQQVTYFICSKI